MHIGIDGFEANTTQRVGIGQYGFQLLTHLHQIDHHNEYTIFLPTAPLNDMPPRNDRWRYVIGRPLSLWTIRQLPGLIKKIAPDVFFSPTHYAPWFTSIPKVVSVMDLSYLHCPELFRTKDLLQLKYMGGRSIRNAQKILTISEFSKQEIMHFYGKKDDEVVVTYPGIHAKIKSQKSTLRFKNHKLNDSKYILFVGTIQPRKNIVRLIEAFEQLEENVLLVIVGKKGWLYQSIIEKMDTSTKRDKIIYLHFVSDEELISLYTHAECLVLPSLYEGFGIPVAEAMSYGCPVVVSNTSSLPEIAGPAAILVDPTDTKSIAEGVQKALQLTSNKKQAVSQISVAHVQKFDWEKCARKTLEVLTTC